MTRVVVKQVNHGGQWPWNGLCTSFACAVPLPLPRRRCCHHSLKPKIWETNTAVRPTQCFDCPPLTARAVRCQRTSCRAGAVAGRDQGDHRIALVDPAISTHFGRAAELVQHAGRAMAAFWVLLVAALGATGAPKPAVAFAGDLPTAADGLGTAAAAAPVPAGPSRRRAAPVLAYVTPWNAAGYNLARRHRCRLDYVAPVWFQLRWEQGGVRLTGGHDVDARWVLDLQVPCGSGDDTAEAAAPPNGIGASADGGPVRDGGASGSGGEVRRGAAFVSMVRGHAGFTRLMV